MTKKIYLSLCLTFFISCCCFSQKEGNIWLTSSSNDTVYGIDFNFSPPTQFVIPRGGNAVCDAEGRLLFYVWGFNVYNRYHQLMPNGNIGSRIPGSGPWRSAIWTGGTGPVIVSVPNRPGLYYVIMNAAINIPYGLFDLQTSYTLVDMSLDSGRGDVVQGQKGVVIKDETETIAVVVGDSCTNWLVTSSREPVTMTTSPGDRFKKKEYLAYRITHAGIDTAHPVVSLESAYGLYMGGLFGDSTRVWREYGSAVQQIDFSPQRDKMAACFSQGIVLHDFDPVTGRITNGKLFASEWAIPWRGWMTAMTWQQICFSPDGSKLYAGFDGGSFPGGLYQYDVSQPTASDIHLSGIQLYSTCWGCGFLYFGWIDALKRGPDDKVYFAPGQYWSGSPILVLNNPNLPGWAADTGSSNISLNGGSVWFPPENAIAPISGDTLYQTRCTQLNTGMASLLLPDDAGGILWSTGDTGLHLSVNAPGRYIARYVSSCQWHTDSFIVFPEMVIQKGCSNRAYAWSPPVPGAGDIFTYIWRDGLGNVIREQAGSNGDSLIGLSPGDYSLSILTPGGCSAHFKWRADTRVAPSADFTIDTIVCTEEPVQYINQQGANWQWNFGDGNKSGLPFGVHYYKRPGIYTVSLSVSDGVCTDTKQKTVNVYTLDLELTADKDLYEIGATVHLYTGATIPYSMLAWLPQSLFLNQTAYQQTVTASVSTEYRAIGISENGCVDTAAITISVAPFFPNAFSPNGDGLNDYFRPAYPGVYINRLEIYNRWGELIWSAMGPAADKGWEGTHQGKAADAGTYFWQAEVIASSGNTLYYKGDLILIR